MGDLLNHISPDSALNSSDEMGTTREENELSEEEFADLLFFEDLLNEIVSKRRRIKRSAASGEKDNIPTIQDRRFKNIVTLHKSSEHVSEQVDRGGGGPKEIEQTKQKKSE